MDQLGPIRGWSWHRGGATGQAQAHLSDLTTGMEKNMDKLLKLDELAAAPGRSGQTTPRVLQRALDAAAPRWPLHGAVLVPRAVTAVTAETAAIGGASRTEKLCRAEA